jgi:hypothetical protein
MELGFGPMASLRHIFVIDGKPALDSAMQLALLRRAGHRIEMVEETAERCAIKGTRPDGVTLEVDYTLEEAKHAGIASKATWTKYPKDMLWARCVSRYARRADAGATLGLYSPADWDAHDTVTLTPEEYAQVTVEPAQAEPEIVEAGELPLRVTDDRILVSCPKCGAKVGTREIGAHMSENHLGEGVEFVEGVES